MAIQTEDSNDIDFVKGYADAIAQAANSWAYLEYNIDSSIWAVAETAPGLGACITAQIPNLTARLNALLSLMKHRGMNERLIKRVQKFRDDSRGPNEHRNRIVQGMWMADSLNDKAMAQLTVTAPKKLTFFIQSMPYSELEEKVRTIIKCRHESQKIRDAILAALTTLPGIPLSSLQPMTEHREGR